MGRSPAIGQTRQPDEIVVVNDGSTDDTAAAIEPFLRRIRYVEQPNAGATPAKNRAALEATTEYVSFP